MEKTTIVVSFSGGKTSAYMARWLIKEYGHLYNFIFIFANTGCELEETLIFVDKCDREFGLNLMWVEAVVNPIHGKGITHRITNFKDAYRLHQYKDPKHPFHAHIAKSGIPNANKPQCSDRLKALTIEHYKKVNGLKGVKHAIGMRSDEANRVLSAENRNNLRKHYNFNDDDVEKFACSSDGNREIIMELKGFPNSKNVRSKYKSNYNLYYPLYDEGIEKVDVNIFWEMQDFTLEIKEHEGNCATCWKKSDKKLWLLSLEAPWKFEAFRWWEKTYSHIKPNDDGKPRVFFRNHKSIDDLFKQSENMDKYTLRVMIGYKDDQDSGCSESCNGYLND